MLTVKKSCKIPTLQSFHHLRSGESNGHPSQWLLSQQFFFLIWTSWKCVSHHKPTEFFMMQSGGIPRFVLIRWNAETASISQWWYQWNTFSSSCSTPCSTHFMAFLAHTLHHAPTLIISLQSCMDLNDLRVVLITYYKFMHFTIHFNPGANWLFLHTSFPFCHWTFSLGF